MLSKENRFQEFYKKLYGKDYQQKNSTSDLHKSIIILNKKRHSRQSHKESLCTSEGLSKGTVTMTSKVFDTNNTHRLQPILSQR